MIKISAVSYTNAKPFVYGLMHSKIIHEIELILDNPSECAAKLSCNKVDIGLIPVASLFQNSNYQIISDYCIGATGAVNSVFIFTNKPIQQIETIRLDAQSRTSNALAKILLKHYWNHSPEFVHSESADAFVEIGDRTFGKKDRYQYAYDLSEEWTKFTGLPFVFAVWATNTSLEPNFIKAFNSSLKLGLDNRHQVISELPKRVDFDLAHYLMNQIDYHFDANKKQALKKFLDLLSTVDQSNNYCSEKLVAQY